MHGKRLNAVTFCQLCNSHAIYALVIPAGANLERYGHADGTHHRGQDGGDQGLVTQQRGTTGAAADFFCGAPHVDVDDLGAPVSIQPRGLREHFRLGARELHHPRLRLSGVIQSMPRLRGVPQARVAGEHFRCSKASAELARQDAERAIRDPRHGRQHRTPR